MRQSCSDGSPRCGYFVNHLALQRLLKSQLFLITVGLSMVWHSRYSCWSWRCLKGWFGWGVRLMIWGGGRQALVTCPQWLAFVRSLYSCLWRWTFFRFMRCSSLGWLSALESMATMVWVSDLPTFDFSARSLTCCWSVPAGWCSPKWTALGCW